MSSRNNIAPTSDINTPAIQTTAGTILVANTDRRSLMLQNVGTNPIFIRFGGTASTTLFHFILKGGTADSDGLGASYTEDGGGTVHTGLISMAGTTPKIVVTES